MVHCQNKKKLHQFNGKFFRFGMFYKPGKPLKTVQKKTGEKNHKTSKRIYSADQSMVSYISC